jgi:uncharacterized protein (DUF488 family)
MPSFDLFTIGHSNSPADRFVALIRTAGAGAIADVRSTPSSRFCPWFSRKNLTARLDQENVTYLFYGDVLGGRPRDPALYCDGVADYEAMALSPQFRSGVERLIADAARHRVCLMCAEREPLDCHRCLLVARAFAERGVAVGHILHDGTIEPHTAIERQLIADSGGAGDLFATGQNGRLAAAYRRRARAVAFRPKAGQLGANSA